MKIEYYTDSKKDKNEDIYGYTSHGAFVLDGASSLVKTNFSPGGNDVHWMVNWWKRYLENSLDHLDKTIIEILQEGVKTFRKDFGKFTDLETLSVLEQVSAGIAVVRKKEAIFECFVLGDVEITVEDKDGQVDIVTDSTIKILDLQVINMISQSENRENRIVYKGFTAEELDILKKNRMKMNQKDGYSILATSVEAINKGIYKTYPLHHLKRCLLSTDGINPLDNYYMREDLLDEMHKRGVKDLIDELRDHEKEDLKKKKVKRLKTHDDATAVLLEFRTHLS